jgi:acyl-CoA thioesterase-1
MNNNKIGAILKISFLYALLFWASCADKSKAVTKPEQNNTTLKPVSEANPSEDKTILFFGNSLTAGMGLDPQASFPALIQEKLDSLGMAYQVINSGLSGETTASGKNRLGWVLKQPIDVFVLELGANDGLRGISLAETRANLQAIIDQVRAQNPDVTIVLAGMQIPPNMGTEYTTEFRAIFPELAKENKISLIPFLLEDVAGISELNQQDGIHPTEAGHRILAANVWDVLKEIL